MYTFDKYELGRTDEVVEITTRDENRMASIKMAQQCRKSIDIISRNLEPHIYDNTDFIDAIKKLVLDNRKAKVRILVTDAKSLVQKGHRLIPLSYTLSSYIEFRIPNEDYKESNDSLFLADSTGYIHRLNDHRFEGILNFNDKRVSKHLLHTFDEIWSRANPDSNLRQVHI